MTPLAYDLLKDLTTRNGFRAREPFFHARGTKSENARRQMWAVVNEYKFFDLIAVQDLAEETAVRMLAAYCESGGARFNARLAFLPAPSTWLEMDHTGSGDRFAILLHGPDSTSECKINMLWRTDGAWSATDFGDGLLPLIDSGKKPVLLDPQDDNSAEIHRAIRRAGVPPGEPGLNPTLGLQFNVYGALAIINSPRIIGRRQHMPHERIERDKLKALGLVGKFPLRAWTEIVLKVALPDDRTGEPSTEAHLTGQKCLHFCRTHLRWCNGQLEYVPVEGHWRGNPALGMKRSRYRVEE